MMNTDVKNSSAQLQSGSATHSLKKKGSACRFIQPTTDGKGGVNLTVFIFATLVPHPHVKHV